ncbi:hypothetical protein Plhal710r2_c009g0041761 [Plasmopara halstedii]
MSIHSSIARTVSCIGKRSQSLPVTNMANIDHVSDTVTGNDSVNWIQGKVFLHCGLPERIEILD